MAFLDLMLEGFMEILGSPFREFGVLWLIIPLVLLWVVLEIYFDIHKGEALGWNTALGNGITLFWITADVMRALFVRNPADFWLRFGVTMLVLFYAVMIIYFSFTHKISEKWDYLLSSPTPIYYVAGITILWGYGVLTVNRFVALDLFILFIAVLIFKQIVRKLMPTKEDFGAGMGGGDLGGGLGGGMGGAPSGPPGGMDDFKMPEMPKF